MNFPIAVLLLCALIGLADKMIGGRFGLAEEFDRGMTMMGSLAVTMSGVYCFSVMLGRLLSTVLQQGLNAKKYQNNFLSVNEPYQITYSISLKNCRSNPQ